MFNPSALASPPEPFTPVGGLPDWTQAMRRATRAHRCGQVAAALSQYQVALALVHSLMPHPADAGSPPPATTDARVEACMCALVSNHRCLAALQADAGDADGAAHLLAQAHVALLALMRVHPPTSAWHRAARWYSQDTHAALLSHVAEQGAGQGVHPAIADALRAGCMVLRTPAAPGTRLH